MRYAEEFDRYYKSMMDAKDLNYELVTEFQYVLIMSRNNPLARLKTITYDDLSDYVEIARARSVRALAAHVRGQARRAVSPIRSTAAYSCSSAPSQFELLSNNERTFMWVSPVPNMRIWSTTAWCSASAAKTSAPTRTL